MRIILLSSHYAIRALSALSLLGAMLSVLYSMYVVVVLMIKHTAEGWATLSLQISGLFFLVFLVLTVMGEYIYRLFALQQDRQVYLISRESTSRVFASQEKPNLVGSQSEQRRLGL